MDKIEPVFQDTPVTEKTPEAVSTWYVTETKEGHFSSTELPWLLAQGWEIIDKERQLMYESTSTYTTMTTYGYYYKLQRRVIKPETVLDDLVVSYTDAYNEGRQLNDQRYDDALVLYMAGLDSTEDTFNSLENSDDTFEADIEGVVAHMISDCVLYWSEIEGLFDDYGDTLITQIANSFKAKLADLRQDLVNRGVYNSTTWTSVAAGIERDRVMAITDAQEQILDKQMSVEDKKYAAVSELRNRILEAKLRLKDNLRSGVETQVKIRNQMLEALLGFVERRTDGYPSLDAIGELASSLGAGAAGVYVP